MKGWELRVSQRELQRVHVEGRESVGRAAKLLGISPRQMKRLRRKIKQGGVEALVYGNRGKAAWNKTALAKKEEVIRLAQGRYRGLNDTHLTEKLNEKENISVSRPTVRRVLRAAGIVVVRKGGVKRHYKRRERKGQEGKLLLWDGSPHRWFGEQQAEWSLMAAIAEHRSFFAFATKQMAQIRIHPEWGNECVRVSHGKKGRPTDFLSVTHQNSLKF
jgi:transposase